MWASIWPEEVLNSVEDRTLISDANPGITMAWHGDGPYINGTPLQQMFSVVTGGSVDTDTGEPCYPEPWDWFPTVDVEDALALTTIDAARDRAEHWEGEADRLTGGRATDLLGKVRSGLVAGVDIVADQAPDAPAASGPATGDAPATGTGAGPATGDAPSVDDAPGAPPSSGV